METKMKKCSRCGRILPIAKFSKRSNSRDGFQYICKECNASIADARKKAVPKKAKHVEIPMATENTDVALDLSHFSVGDIVAELRRRNYRGTLECVHVVKV